ncbi:branched-chain amino acid ABC transporter permease [Roseovarius atlanticus]|uniref:branched-chain amino acid ABC transporter permease n=1 Tax=Roseovarius atlanticus TaxID=1641875 RepID=UPI001C968CF0|nr:branched-chain amino acid ABC transporter permease [Roseovarius atlanticus]MBY5989965.1 branched-chain amino acid ABC transporter permease [Roseovarius atlanticus]MBY6126510.1 branched-chain amino acid ABC transporter permease [Roseovarius atlanticus]MBY6151004.1 branched-chain amino acid ABC transporter permease [Roseovarius atlanticus]
MELLLTTLVSGAVLGALYALMASGLSLVWTTLGVFNFAHGALMMIGACVAWTVAEPLGLGLWMGMAAGVGAAAMLGVIIEYLLVRPFYGRPNMLLITVMTTLAAMIVMEKSAQMIWGARLKQLPRLIEGDVSFFGAVFSAHEALIIVIAPVILIALWAFATRTATGRSLRAVGQNQDAAALLGINVPLTFGIAFGLGAALAGLAGVLLGGIRFITPTLGAEPLVKAMIVVIFGGLGSLGATVGAAFVIGMAEAFLVLVVGLYWTPFMLFLGLIVVLIFRPNGLFGRA